MQDGHLLTDSIKALVSATEGKANVTIAASQAAAIKAIGEEKPDILHMHVCWSWWAQKVVEAARQQGCAIVLSPHGALSPFTLRHEQPLRKRLRIMVYQRKLIRQCDALLAEDEAEEEVLKAWHDRTGLLPNALLDSSLTAEEMGNRAMAFYRKAVDTRYHALLTADERKAVFALLHVGISHEPSTRLLSHDTILNLRALKPQQWRRIMLLADDEGIRTTLDRAISVMQLDVPNIDARAIDRFPLRHPKERGSLPTKKLIAASPIKRAKTKDRLADLELDDTLQDIAMSILNAETLLRDRRLSLRHLAELYEDIRYTDFDEDNFGLAMRRLHHRTFARRLTALLHSTMQLDEGFWPIGEKADKTARRMEQDLQTRG